ncbi:MAG TPA: V-type ATP synthase subunit F [Candidatus Ornithospirochaeta avicola]|uniref:V-type ATP synthase subunit F n=1 Tax=Candidatus Ornithospirochaeta avicola TaxID=2840896 RepID=A0A9D1PUX7_9SPIO|nr:V-type ATP synthase subunit F [Candidatus Ornithospirochaeta avicola]
MEYYVLGDDDTVLGFSIVGVSGAAVHDADEALFEWKRVIANKNYGIIIITEDVADLIRETVDKYLFSEDFPLVVEIPQKGKGFSRDLKELVNQAIGVVM